MAACSASPPRRAPGGGFTLLEILVTLALLVVILAGLMAVLDLADKSFRSASQDPFADAAEAFDTLCARLGRATLAGYDDYVDASGAFRPAGSTTFVPDHVVRRSDLAFLTAPSSDFLAAAFPTTSGDSLFFVEAAGLTQSCGHEGVGRLLNTLGYFVAFGNASSAPAFATNSARWRWRLEQVAQPSEALGVYQSGTASAWATQAAGVAEPLAENIILLIVLPERPADSTLGPLAPDFRYDSRDTASGVTRDQLPTRVTVLLVAIDEPSAARLAAANGTKPPQLVPASSFQSAGQFDPDETALDATLTRQRVRHRIFRRDVALAAAQWTETSVP